MARRVFGVFVIVICAASSFVLERSAVEAQLVEPDGIHLSGRVEKQGRLSGFFSSPSKGGRTTNWCVFVGANGSVYKLTLLDRSVQSLVLDGQPVESDRISRYAAEFNPFLERFLRDAEIERESNQIDTRMEPIDAEMESLDTAMEKIESAADRLGSRGSAFAAERSTLDAERKKISATHKSLANLLKPLADRQEALSEEQERLNLMADIDRILDVITNDLIALGVIKTDTNLSFKLSSLGLIVNGKPISGEAHRFLRAKYIVDGSGESGFLYRWKGKV